MTKIDGKTASTAVKDSLLANPDGLARGDPRRHVRQVIEAEMDEALGAVKGERTLLDYARKYGYIRGEAEPAKMRSRKDETKGKKKKDEAKPEEGEVAEAEDNEEAVLFAADADEEFDFDVEEEEEEQFEIE